MCAMCGLVWISVLHVQVYYGTKISPYPSAKQWIITSEQLIYNHVWTGNA